MSTARPLAVRAGTDTTCGDEYVALVQAVKDGLIKESEIDTALKRLFTARFRLGMFDPPDAVAFNQIPYSEDDSPEHRQLALQAARESMVLLKNQDGFLPLKSDFKTIAVIGPNAESLAALEGNYNGQAVASRLPGGRDAETVRRQGQVALFARLALSGRAARAGAANRVSYRRDGEGPRA